MVKGSFNSKREATIGQAVMDGLKETVGKRVAVESFDGKKASFIEGMLVEVRDFRSVTVKLDNDMRVIIDFIGRGNKDVRQISSEDGVIYDNSENVGKSPLKKMVEFADGKLLLRNRTFGKKVTMEIGMEDLDARLDFLDELVKIRRNP